ncbi:MAG: hypothetical protein ACK5NB_14300 [Flavobacteriaceae bacterium]
MKSFFSLLFILFVNIVSSQSKWETEALKEARKHWKSYFEYAINNPEILINPHLKLISFEPLNENQNENDIEIVEKFLRQPIDSLQVVPKFTIPKEMPEKMNKGEHVESTINLVVFSKMPLAEQYRIIGQKVYMISELLFKKEKLKIVKLNWEYLNNPFNTYCVVSESKIEYDIIMFNMTVFTASSATE